QNSSKVVHDRRISLRGSWFIGGMYPDMMQVHFGGFRDFGHGRFGRDRGNGVSSKERFPNQLVPLSPLRFHGFARRSPGCLSSALPVVPPLQEITAGPVVPRVSLSRALQ